jgi:hypothetical protein
MSIFKETFKKGVEDQLKARQEAIVERTPNAIQYFNSRNAWIRMTSSVDVGGSGELARSYVLLGGTLLDGKLRSGIGASGAYSATAPGGQSHRLGIRPMPGITSIDVKSKSAYGSLREVTINFNAWDLRQLEDLELLYMRPGYSVLVEWGWMPYLTNGKGLGTNVDFENSVLNGSNTTKEEIWKTIFNRSSKDGNYDAIYGFIKNYSWSARPDGGYDCTTTLITMGEILESLKVNYGPFVDKAPDKGLFDTLPASAFEKDTITSKAYNQNIIAGICSELYEILKKQITADTTEGTFNGWTFYRFNVDVTGKDAGNTIVSEGAQIYITLKDFVDILNKKVLISDVKAKKPLLELSVFCGEHNGGTSTPLTCLGDIQQLSTDPSVCLIKNINWVDPAGSLGITVSSSDNATLKKIMETLTQDYWYNGFDKQQLGVIGNIYVNLDYIYSLVTNPDVASQDKKEKNDIALFDFIKTMMSGINNAIGSVATFELFIDPVDSIARIIDVNYTGNREEDWAKAVIIEMQKLGSVVRSYKLESQIFPEQSTMIAIGAQAQGGALGENVNTMVDFNQNLIDRIVPVKDSPLAPTTTEKTAAEIEEENKEKEKIRKENLSTLIDYISKIDADFWESKGDFDAGEASKYSNALKDQINYYRSNTNADTKNRAIIPTKLSIEMDGIGGIIIGNIFRIPEEILPRGYKGGGAGPSKIGYVVTGIGHSIQNNDWKTNLDAQFIILDPPKGGIPTADSKAIKAGNKEAQSPENKPKSGSSAPKKPDDKPTPPGTPPGPPSKDLPPELTVDKVIAAMQRKGYSFYANTPTGRNKLNIVGIRNIDKDLKKPATNYFSDIVVMFYYDDKGARHERIGRWTTMPGYTYEGTKFGDSTDKSPGTRTIDIKEGQYKGKYVQGFHRKQAKALRQKDEKDGGSMNYTRDKTLNLTYNDDGSETASNATNIHNSGDGGANDPKKRVDNWSAGCQVFRNKADFNWMGQAADNQIAKTKIRTFDYTLLNIRDIPGFEKTTTIA